MLAFTFLEGVTLPNGVVKTANGTFDYTQYTAMIDLGQKVYYFKTYENPQVIQVDMKPLWKSKEKVVQDLGSIQTSIFYGHFALKKNRSRCSSGRKSEKFLTVLRCALTFFEGAPILEITYVSFRSPLFPPSGCGGDGRLAHRRKIEK